MTELFNQSWQIQLALASGYAAYTIAYVGVRHHHRAIDITFKSILFALVTTFVLAILPTGNSIASGATAFVATCAFAIAWRKWLSEFVQDTLSRWNVTWSNDDPSALFTISNRKSHITQVAVELEDGKWLRCDNAHEFNDAPFGPLTVGPGGDIALYLTHEEKPGKDARELSTVRHEQYGDRITYIPAARIRQIAFRHLPKN